MTTEYEKENQSRINKIRNDLTAIGKAVKMVPDFTDNWDHGARLNGENGKGFFIRADWLKKTYEVSCLWPRLKGYCSPRDFGVVGYDDDYVREIKFSMAKDHEKMIVDIKRRLLPEYNRLFDLCEIERKNRIDEESKKRHLLFDLAQFMGQEVRDDSDKFYCYDEKVSADVRVSSAESVTMEIRSMSPKLAKSILALIKEIQS